MLVLATKVQKVIVAFFCICGCICCWFDFGVYVHVMLNHHRGGGHQLTRNVHFRAVFNCDWIIRENVDSTHGKQCVQLYYQIFLLFKFSFGPLITHFRHFFAWEDGGLNMEQSAMSVIPKISLFISKIHEI